MLALLLVVLSMLFLLFAWQGIAGSPLQGAHASFQLLCGVVVLLVGLAGPVRIVRKGAQIPAEIRQLIGVQALILPVWGLVFIAGGLVGSSIAIALAYAVAALLLLFSAVAGFYRLSNSLPPTFYIGEMLAVIKTVGLTKELSASPADREFRRWTGGLREGVTVGEYAPDGDVVTLAGDTVTLSSYLDDNPGNLLVLNFGSYSCPHQRKRLDELRQLQTHWQQHGVGFLTVYTVEAHPEDGWKLPDQYAADDEFTTDDDFCFSYARSIEDRATMARWLIDKKHFLWPVVLDNMDNSLMRDYNSWPIRLYVLRDRQVVFCGDQGPFGYEPAAVERFLRRQESP
jgi:hypothetical protein